MYKCAKILIKAGFVMEKERTKEINIMDILFILKKNSWIIILVAILMAAAFYAYTVTMETPMYSASTSLMIKELTPQVEPQYSDSTSKMMLVNNCMEVMSGTEVMQMVVDDLELDMTPEQLQKFVTISSPADTLALKITVIHPDPKTAKEICDKLADVTEEVLAKNIGVAALTTYQQAKTPEYPVSPNPVKSGVMGGFLGAFITAAICLLIRFINNKIYTPEDAEKALGLTVFASIPLVSENTTDSQPAAEKQ